MNEIKGILFHLGTWLFATIQTSNLGDDIIYCISCPVVLTPRPCSKHYDAGDNNDHLVTPNIYRSSTIITLAHRVKSKSDTSYLHPDLPFQSFRAGVRVNQSLLS